MARPGNLNIKGDGVTGSPVLSPLLTDYYQLTMAYAYWKTERHRKHAVFELFFRKSPFKGNFAVFAGLSECIRFLKNYKFTKKDVSYLKSLNPTWEDAFFAYLSSLDGTQVTLHALPEGSVVFPRQPLIIVEGELAAVQLLETTFLVLVNYATLIATNAARHRLISPGKVLIEFGLRRAQGPNGGISAARYAYIGGFHGTSNVEAGHLFDIPIKGTHAHSFVGSFTSLDELKTKHLNDVNGMSVNFVDKCLENVMELCNGVITTNAGELTAFIAYAQSFPNGFVALIDTYNTLLSGAVNFMAVALSLHQLGYAPIGVRIDSGDLAYLSKELRAYFRKIATEWKVPFADLKITASNDISEATITQLNRDGHEIDVFGIGTHLVTCKTQPALGGVYKLVQLEKTPRIKCSEQVKKVTIPAQKRVWRCYKSDGTPLCDVLTELNGDAPRVGQGLVCRDPYGDLRVKVDQIVA